MITMQDVLRLPCMQGAEIVAGHAGMHRQVKAVSVLEYTDPTPLQADIFRSFDFQQGELAISALINVKDDVEAQCNVIRRLSAYGDIGMLLYYVGVFVQRIDERLVQVADELNFVLVCMPENDTTLRYSEAITEIMNAVFSDEADSNNFIADILNQISTLPGTSRTIDTMLHLLAERTGTALELQDSAMHVLTSATCHSLDADRVYRGTQIIAGQKKKTGETDGLHYLYTTVSGRNSPDMYLAIIHEGSPVSNSLAKQITKTVQLFVSIWSGSYSRADNAELMRAILLDEPMKMHHLALRLNIDLTQLQGMIVFYPDSETPGFTRRILEIAARQCITSQPLLSEIINGIGVMFVRRELFRSQHAFMDSMADAVHTESPGTKLFVCYNLAGSSAIRNAWLLLEKQAELCARLYPSHCWYSLQKASFTALCAEILESGEQIVQKKMEPLLPLDTETQPLRDDLYRTLAVFLLDAGSNIADTAVRMSLHRNTIKYRIHKISEDLGYRPDEMPEEQDLYLAVALKRLLNG